MDMPVSAKSTVKAEYKKEYKAEYKIKNKPIYSIVKRIFDFTFSLLALILLIPVFVIIAIAIKLDDGGPVFYVSNRVGKDGKIFGVYKFRSMVLNADQLIQSFTPEQKKEFENNFKIQNDPRITKIGRFIRKTSLDELPQLLNILKGDMSFVGPRPVTKCETELYGKYKDILLSVRPGLTGFWAANGRSNITYRRRKAMEIYYVKNQSLMLDLKILLKTILVVFTGI